MPGIEEERRELFAPSKSPDTRGRFWERVADDVDWTVEGAHPLPGRYRSKADLAELRFLARAEDGGLYDHPACWVWRFGGDRTPTLTFGSTRQVLSIFCGIGQTLVATCSGTATPDVAAPEDRPLEVFISPAAEGTASASRAGRPPVSFPPDEAADHTLDSGGR